MSVERMPREMRKPPRPCSENCPGWGVFNGNDLQACDECWLGVEDAPADDYFDTFPECRVALLVELVKGASYVSKKKAEEWARDVARELLEEFGYLVLPPEKAEIEPEVAAEAIRRLREEGFHITREWKVGDAARLYGERGVAWLVEEVYRDRLTVRLVGDDCQHHVWARDCEWLPPGSYCGECGQESCGHAREEVPEMIIDPSAILTRPGEDLIETVRDARQEDEPS